MVITGYQQTVVFCYLKYFNVDPKPIKSARDKIKDALQLKHLSKICSAFKVIWSESQSMKPVSSIALNNPESLEKWRNPK
jgi:hypothetical protein